MSHFEIDLQFKSMVIAEDILNTLYTETSTAIEKYSLTDGFCNVYIPTGEKTIFAEVVINAVTFDVSYYVTSDQNKSKHLPALSYSNALRELRALMV